MSSRTTMLIALALLAVCAIVSIVLHEHLGVDSSFGKPTAGQIQLGGVVRDFRSDHDDFEVVPDLGYGHYAGNVDVELGGGGRPVFTGEPGTAGGPGQVRVAETLRIITKASIISGGAAAVVSTNSTAAGAIYLEGNCSILNDVLVGPGGNPATVIDNDGTITGSTGTLGAAFPMPPVVPPSDTVVGPNLGDAQYNSGTTVIDSNRHLDSLRVNTNGVVEIVGNIVILCEGNLTVETGGSIVVNPGNSLDLYVKGQVAIKTKSQWSDPTNTRIHVIGSPQFKVETEADFYGSIYAPETDVLVQTKSIVHGSVVCRNLLMKTESVIEPAAAGSGPALTGFKVLTAWTDTLGRAIAPHMEDAGAPAAGGDAGHLAVNAKLTTKDPGTLIDGYRSSVGPYGGSNAGLDVVVSSNGTSSNIINLADTTITGDVLAGPGADTGEAVKLNSCTIEGSVSTLAGAVAMPILSEPSLGASVGDVTYNGGVSTLSSNLHGDKIFLDGSAVLQIDGNITILCENEFKTTANSQLRLLPGATLTLYTKGNLKFEDGSVSNANTADPGRFLCYHLGSNPVKIDQGSVVHARIEAPIGNMEVAAGSEFFGTFVGDELTVEGPSWFHYDLGGAAPASCLAVSDTAGVAGGASSGGITSAATFNQWYRDVAGTNSRAFHRITLTDDGSGVYEYLDDEFHPIDDRVLGNEGYAHNNHFTYHIGAEFTYGDCGGRFLEFEGNDDLWIFIDDKLVMDAGGIGPAKRQIIELDRLELTDGEVYSLELFHAQRRAGSSVFRLRTNIELGQPGIPQPGDAYD